MKNKVLLALLMVIIIINIPISSFALEVGQKQNLTISLEDAYKKAISATFDFQRNDKNIYKLLKPFGATKIVNDRNQYNMESEFKRLYEKLRSGKFLQSYEQGELVMYYAIFKDSELFEKKDLTPTIYPYDFPNCETWVSMMQMKISNELLRTNIVDSVRQVFDNLIDINDNISIMIEYNKALELEYKEAILDYQNGKISELERSKIASNYEVQKLELNKQKRTKENVERNLKKSLGINLNDEIQIVPYKVLEKDLVIPSYERCLNKALLNRNEIAVAKMNLLATQNQLVVLDNYIWYLPHDEGIKMTKLETLLRIDELQNDKRLQEELVSKDINTMYAEIEYMNKSVIIEKINLQAAQKEYDSAILRYKSGGVSNKALAAIKIEYKKTKATYDRTLRELAYKISKLNSSCGVG